MRAKHIGIVGCSAEGAALCYRTICLEGKKYMGEHNHPEITMHTHALHHYTPLFPEGDWEGVAQLMLSSAHKLHHAGAEFLISPDNTIHQAWDWVVKETPLPWLHIADAVGHEASGHSYQTLGVLGTRYLMEGPVYPERLKKYGMKTRIPEPEERDEINSIIFNELVYATITEKSLSRFQAIIHGLKEKGCDAVVLGCTEIPLLITSENSPLPPLDSTRLLARAALSKACEKYQ